MHEFVNYLIGALGVGLALTYRSIACSIAEELRGE